ncbi:MAG: hypothetical protein H7338_02245 [Candidatus Sericytochromatia bacterium]|nr:hypothetical protein [Candidatus Sericytochromatia bacterium]
MPIATEKQSTSAAAVAARAKRVTFKPGAEIVLDGMNLTITLPSGHVVSMLSRNVVLAPMLPVGIPVAYATI